MKNNTKAIQNRYVLLDSSFKVIQSYSRYDRISLAKLQEAQYALDIYEGIFFKNRLGKSQNIDKKNSFMRCLFNWGRKFK